jgi:hypothetical protein
MTILPPSSASNRDGDDREGRRAPTLHNLENGSRPWPFIASFKNRAFGPDEIKVLTAAYEEAAACRGDSSRESAPTRRCAQRARRGRSRPSSHARPGAGLLHPKSSLTRAHPDAGTRRIRVRCISKRRTEPGSTRQFVSKATRPGSRVAFWLSVCLLHFSQEKIRAAPSEGGDVRASLSPPIRDRGTQQIAKGESGLIQEKLVQRAGAGRTRRLCRRYGVQQN